MAITRRQHELYDFLSRFVAEKGYSPSYEEIKEGLGLSSLATVHKHVTNLEKKGLLTRDYNRSRSIDLLPPKGKLKQSMAVNTAVVLPLVGRIAAGRPIEAVQNNETISLADFVRSKEVFVLQVRGDSMQDEAILDGDYVLVEKAKDGAQRGYRGGAGRDHRRDPEAFLSRGGECPAAAVECGDETDHRAGGDGGDPGKSHWGTEEVLKSSGRWLVVGVSGFAGKNRSGASPQRCIRKIVKSLSTL